MKDTPPGFLSHFLPSRDPDVFLLYQTVILRNDRMFKDLREYKLELSEIYRTISPREDMDKMETSIEDLVDSTKNSVNEKRSRIKSAFVGKFTDEIAVNYYIVGRGSESKKINFDRELITDKSGILSMQTPTAR